MSAVTVTREMLAADPGLRPALLALAGPDERGDPVPPLRWTAKSTRALAAELTRQQPAVASQERGWDR